MTFLAPAINAALWLLQRWASPFVSLVAGVVPEVASIVGGLVDLLVGDVRWMGVSVSVPSLMWSLTPWLGLDIVVALVVARVAVRQGMRVFQIAQRVWGWTPFG